MAAFLRFSLLRSELSPSSAPSSSPFTGVSVVSIVDSKYLCVSALNRTSYRFSDKMHVFLKDIVPVAQNNINMRFIILDKARSPSATSGKICIALAADETAAVHIQLWGDECDTFEPGDIVKLTNGIFSYVRNSGLLLRAGKRGKMEKMGEFTIAFVEMPNVSEIQWNLIRRIPNAILKTASFPPLP